MLTDEELSLVEVLGNAHTIFARMDEVHPSDLSEWEHHVHALQNILMSRAAVRAHPEFFTHKA